MSENDVLTRTGEAEKPSALQHAASTEKAAAFNGGDWVFCEFKLQLIRRVEDERVTEVTDGVCSHSSYDMTDRCMPLTYEMKQIADAYNYESQRIHRDGSNGLNYPDIHQWLVDHWVGTCAVASDRPALEARWTELHEFARSILAGQHVDSGYGFPLLRRR